MLGDSFVWGYDVEVEDRFTETMQAARPTWDVVNMGVSGYGTDQEYLLLRKLHDRVQPDVVVLVFYANDHADNSSNVRCGGYYKPYFVEELGGLVLKGTPVPRSINYDYARVPRVARTSSLFRAVLTAWQRLSAPPPVTSPDPTAAILRELSGFVRTRRSALILVSVGPEPMVEQVALPYVALPSYPITPSGHWTRKGHAAVAGVLAQAVADLVPLAAR